MSNVENFTGEKYREYPKEQELIMDLQNVLDKYVGEFSIMTALGVLDIVKSELLDMRHEDY